MQNIILEGKEEEGIVFDLVELAEYLGQLNDPRDNRGKVYPLGVVLSMIVLARLSGEDKTKGIFEWLRYRREAFKQVYGFKKAQTPCMNTIRTTLSKVVNLDEFEKRLKSYLYERYGGQESVLIAIDGKTMRGTIPKGFTRGVHLLSAYLATEGVVLKQVEVQEKSNEISAAPELLAALNLKRKVVCADAMHTQRAFSTAVLSGGGNYLLVAKENQERLRADIEQYFHPARRVSGWHIVELPRTTDRKVNKGHGRLETRTLTLMPASSEFLQWPGVQQVFRLERHSRVIRTGKETTEVTYGLTSCAAGTVDAAQLAEWIRAYWAIENGLHYRRDVTLGEDATRTELTSLAQAIAIINNFLIGLVQMLGYSNLASARRYFDARIAQQLSFNFY